MGQNWAFSSLGVLFSLFILVTGPLTKSMADFCFVVEDKLNKTQGSFRRNRDFDKTLHYTVKSCGIPLGPPLDTWLLRKLLFGRLDVARTELGLVVLYLNKAEARDKICRAIQYGSKFLSNGEAGTTQNVEKVTSLARKVFRLFKFVNDLHALISPTAPGTPFPIVLLGKSKNALLSTFLFLDQIFWLHRSGIYKNKEHAEIISRISLFCWMGSSVCTTLVEIGEIGRVSKSIKKLDKELKGTDKYKNEQYRAKIKASNERSLALIKAAMDIVVAAGLLQLAPKKITPRVTGAFGFTTSLISCYQLLPSQPKSKTP